MAPLSDEDIDDVMEVAERRHTTTAPDKTSLDTSKHRLDAKEDMRLAVKAVPSFGAVTKFGQGGHSHSPLSSVLAQYKEAEVHWAREKAALRREATIQRRRAQKLDLENRKLAAANKHKAMDISALKAALKSRDQQLQALESEVTKYESALAENKEATDQQNADILFERDELKTLLKATMKRLEGMDDFINETVANTTELETRLDHLHKQKDNAVQAASRSQSLKKELESVRKKLSLQQNVLNKVADIQLKRNKKQKESIKDVLQFASDGLMGSDSSDEDVLNTVDSLLDESD